MSTGLIISWATPDTMGEGHVNTKTAKESRKIVESMGFKQDKHATRKLRDAAELEWVGKSIAFYHRVDGQSLNIRGEDDPDNHLLFQFEL